MNQNKSVIFLVLDRSGSMSPLQQEVIGSVNGFFDEQAKLPGECLVQMVQFDNVDPYEVICPLGPIANRNRLTQANYTPRGQTPLLDAVGRGINDLGAKLAAMPEDQRPGKVIFVIQTDGLENASREFDLAKVGTMIAHQTKEYNWQFVFLGANFDAYGVGSALNVNKVGTMAMGPSRQNIRAAYAASNRAAADYRSGKSEAMSFTPEEKTAGEAGSVHASSH